jgi:DNA topoisomerase-1
MMIAMAQTLECIQAEQRSDPLFDLDPEASALAAGLRYVTDDIPGICRKKSGKDFRYIGPDGTPVRDPQELKRIRSLAIPPAYTEVWISPLANGHLQATGRDARGRKQYRYHPLWRQVRDETKFSRMLAFGKALPHIRARAEADLALPGLPRRKALAAVVRLLERTHIRVGNEEYARANDSYGLTTLRNEHVDVDGPTLQFCFRGKSGKFHTVRLNDRKLARIVRQCKELPGQELFQYLGEDGALLRVDSDDVNRYLREITGQNFSAKDFRTWAGTVLATIALQEFEPFETKTQAKKNLLRAVERVSSRLGNTPAVCRKSYVHPAVFEMYLDGTMRDALLQVSGSALAEVLVQLRPEEAAMLALLTEHSARGG